MVAGMLVHLKSLRTHKRGYGPIIRKLLAEAENERMHLMTFIQIAQPTLFERAVLAHGLDDVEQVRYLEAGRLAGSFCAALDDAPHVDALLRILRGFWRDSGAKRLDTMRRLAA